MALVTDAAEGVSYRTSSKKDQWSQAILNIWDDFTDDGEFTERAPSGDVDPMASLAVKKTVAPGATETFTFYLTWSFPNRIAWSDRVEGNYYCLEYPNAWTAAWTMLPYSARTRTFRPMTRALTLLRPLILRVKPWKRRATS